MAHTIGSILGSALGAATKPLGALKIVRVSYYKALEIIMIWQERAEQRCALKELDSRQLKDIGITRADASREAAKPFWLS